MKWWNIHIFENHPALFWNSCLHSRTLWANDTVNVIFKEKEISMRKQVVRPVVGLSQYAPVPYMWWAEEPPKSFLRMLVKGYSTPSIHQVWISLTFPFQRNGRFLVTVLIDLVTLIFDLLTHLPQWLRHCVHQPVQFPGRPVDFVFRFQGRMLWD